MIASFADKATELLFNREYVRSLPSDIQQRARIKLVILDAALTLDELKLPPSNRLERLKGDRAGQFSIRINQQWRICFRWLDNSAHEVEIVDYH